MSWKKFDKEVKSLMHSFRYSLIDKYNMPINISSKIWYHRIDEAFLLISKFMDVSFMDTCKRYKVNYEEFQKLRDNEDEGFLKEFKFKNSQYGIEEDLK